MLRQPAGRYGRHRDRAAVMQKWRSGWCHWQLTRRRLWPPGNSSGARWDRGDCPYAHAHGNENCPYNPARSRCLTQPLGRFAAAPHQATAAERLKRWTMSALRLSRHRTKSRRWLCSCGPPRAARDLDVPPCQGPNVRELEALAGHPAPEVSKLTINRQKPSRFASPMRRNAASDDQSSARLPRPRQGVKGAGEWCGPIWWP